eukprot:COSAG06_NODE_437_length_15768_cov_156.524156_14_plen_110_part_00
MYDYTTWQGGIRAASNWGRMQYNSSSGGGGSRDPSHNRTAAAAATIVEKTGAAWNRNISCGDTHFKGALGGSMDAFADGRGCGWVRNTPSFEAFYTKNDQFTKAGSGRA